MSTQESEYLIKLPKFEGPFDLLLFFIERDELDIQDIPIHTLTEDFLTYIKEMKELNLELASEFILMAATLMRIKAKMLIPRKDVDELGNELDPRKELIDRLLEYQQYKQVIQDLIKLQEKRVLHSYRGNVHTELEQLHLKYSTETELQGLSPLALFKAFQNVLERFHSAEVIEHSITKYPYSIQEEKELLLKRVEEQILSFDQVFARIENKMHAIYRFLGLLEGVQQQFFTLEIRQGFNNIVLSKGNVSPILAN